VELDCNPRADVLQKRLLQAARSSPIDPAVEIQRKYYTNTAPRYDSMHAHEGADDPACRRLIISILRSMEIQSLLDVGSATGRGLQDFAAMLPGALVCGVEPVRALIKQGVSAGNTQTISLLQASGDALPFADASFDAVSEFSTLHHVPNPSAVVREMLRVARRAVVIVDCNRFAQGSLPTRLFKLLLYKIGLWYAFDLVRTRGRRYQISEGDGLFFSYSVYDSYDLVESWADRLFILPSGLTHSRSWFHPLLTAEGVILVGIREAGEDGKTD
jgi:ubiquinone/menaquinone biosynthesis C-methylase UbiE